MTGDPAALGQLLRSRRERLRPADVGLPAGQRRRTAGLRREEVALLASLSTTYYTFLEQGRPVRPSPQVLDALAAALRMSATERRYLHVLAYGPDEGHGHHEENPRAPAPPERLDPAVADLVQRLEPFPTLVKGRRWDVLAANPAARELFKDWETPGTHERNLVRWMFTTDQAREVYLEWEPEARAMLGRFRLAAARYPDDPDVRALIAELHRDSEHVRDWWPRHDVTAIGGSGSKKLRHPRLGPVEYSHVVLQVADQPDQTLVTYSALGPITLDTMKFGVMYNTGAYGYVDPDALLAVARHAEACGFESFYVPEHVALYPGASVGALRFPPDLPIADPLECLSFVAAATERILLGTAVLLLPYHEPVVLAKRLATIDLLSKGRMRLLTIGVGSLPGEAAAVGVDYATRGRRADEAIDVLRLLWAGDEHGVSFDGEFFSVKDACSFPKPLRPIPIHIGGSSPAAARRAGLRGDGYFPGGRLTEAERASQDELMRATARDAGRDPGALEVTRWGSIDLTAEDVARYADRGVHRLVVGPASADPAEQRDQLTAFADRHALP